MDRRASSRAAEVPDVSPGLDLRTPEAINHVDKRQDFNGEGENGEVAPEEVAHEEVAHEEVAHEEAANGEAARHGAAHVEAAQDEGVSDEVINGASKPQVAVPSTEPKRRKKPLSELGQEREALETSGSKRQKRVSEPRDLVPADTDEDQKERVMLQQVPEKLRKYFGQRYRLFHLYDKGIQLDEEGWFSVTPEKIAAHIASRFSHLKVVVDLYSCVGGNSIQFAKAGIHVIAVEIDQTKIDMAENNASVYGVRDRIEFRRGDVFETLSSLKEDFESDWGIFLSPPWGGPSYIHQEDYDVSRFKGIVETARSMSANVAILVPRNTSSENVVETFGRCEVEANYLGGKVKTKTLYFGDLEGRRVAVDDNQ